MDAEFVALVSRHLKYADAATVTGESRLRDQGLDSMRAIDLLFAVEDRYGVTIPDERLTDATFETANNLWAVVEELRTPVEDGHRS
jgi:acyl carrier protein